MSAAPCSTFTPRSEGDATTCGSCGWSAAAHLPPEERPLMVPWVEPERGPGPAEPPLCAK